MEENLNPNKWGLFILVRKLMTTLSLFKLPKQISNVMTLIPCAVLILTLCLISMNMFQKFVKKTSKQLAVLKRLVDF